MTTMSDDCISRKAALKICRKYWHPTFNPIMEEIEKLPSAQPERCEDCENFRKTRLLIPQPEKRTEKCTETHACDLISRQAAIDALSTPHGILYPIRTIENMPSAQPQPKTGEWNFVGNQMFECTNCGVAYTEYQFEKMRVRYNDPKFPRFCPNCGSYNGGDLNEQT